MVMTRSLVINVSTGTPSQSISAVGALWPPVLALTTPELLDTRGRGCEGRGMSHDLSTTNCR